ncbi:MAG TPA: hypothetical protein VL282_03360 [Tepidisphaeraceae bacterium]|jgi:hypothetical protein|nr:hypothetical protein [Tepidisphaeraceae bacterium]
MNRHMLSGGRYPVLRSLAILYLIGAGIAVLAGLVAAGWALVAAPWSVGNRIMLALTALAGTFFLVIGMLAIAEVLKLFIDMEHSMRVAALRGMANTTVAEVPESGGRIGDLDEETAEAALLRGH